MFLSFISCSETTAGSTPEWRRFLHEDAPLPHILQMFGVNLKIWQILLKSDLVFWTALSSVDCSQSIKFGLKLRLCE